MFPILFNIYKFAGIMTNFSYKNLVKLISNCHVVSVLRCFVADCVFVRNSKTES